MFIMSTDVRAISFDIWNTLLRGNKAFTRPRLLLIFKLLDQPVTDLNQLHEAYLQADDFYNDEAERTNLDYGLGERLALMFRILDINALVPSTTGLRNIQTEVGKLRLQPDFMPSFTEPDLPVTLQRLRDQGFMLGLLSNTGIDNEVVMESVLKQLNIWHFFATALFSCKDSRAKPNPELFRRMATELGKEPKQVLHVGDNTNADYRAIEAGLQAVVYAPQGGLEQFPHITSMQELVPQS